MVFQRFPEDTRKRLRGHEDNTEAKRIIKTLFEPQSRQECYKIEFQLCRLTELWLDFADNLNIDSKLLVDHVVPRSRG